jgi:hypothetical protein
VFVSLDLQQKKTSMDIVLQERPSSRDIRSSGGVVLGINSMSDILVHGPEVIYGAYRRLCHRLPEEQSRLAQRVKNNVQPRFVWASKETRLTRSEIQAMTRSNRRVVEEQ